MTKESLQLAVEISIETIISVSSSRAWFGALV
jgi:hypothetical protein